MSQLDDFMIDNPNEDKIQGDEEFMKNTVDADKFSDPNEADDDTVEADTIGREVSLEELAEKELGGDDDS